MIFNYSVNPPKVRPPSPAAFSSRSIRAQTRTMPAQEQSFTTVDAFTEVPFGGNPAAVIVWDDPALAADDQLAQQIAAEFNLSETAFARRLEGGSEEEPRYQLRWRTPTTEVSPCLRCPRPTLSDPLSPPSRYRSGESKRTRGDRHT